MALLTLLLSLALSASANEGPAPTPPMGWSSWNSFGCAIDESLIRETADALVASGLAHAGYRYVNIDDCWQAAQRDASGGLQPDPRRFPGGIRALADYVHARGLKLGIYTSVGTRTCEGLPGSRYHEEQDARRFAAWGVDFVKDDFCGGPLWSRYTFWPWWDYRKHYRAMSEALRRTGRPIVFSLCTWGFGRVWEWGPEIAHLWRTYWDIAPRWWWIMRILDQQRGLEKYAGPGRWNDPDMLEVGVAPLSKAESQAHFGLWAVLAAPLIAGNDIRRMEPWVQEVLANPEIIAVDQDPAGIQGRLVSGAGGRLQVWAKPLAGKGRVAALLLNRGSAPERITAAWTDLGLAAGPALVRDLWAHKDLGSHDASFSATVRPHGAVMALITQTGR